MTSQPNKKAKWTARVSEETLKRKDRYEREHLQHTAQEWSNNIADYLAVDNQLRPLQLEAMEAFINHVSSHREHVDKAPQSDSQLVNKVYYKLPPGLGKTNIAIAYIRSQYIPHTLSYSDAKKNSIANLPPKEVPKTLFVVPTRNLVDQTLDRFQEEAPELFAFKPDGSIDEKNSIVTALRPGKFDTNKRVGIISYPLYVKRVREGKIDPSEYDFLVLDEVHESLTENRIFAAEKFDKAL